MRVLLVAEQANPEWVSVPLVGWSLCREISRITTAHIVTHVRNRPAFLRQGMREGVDFTALDTESVTRPLNQLAHFLRGGQGKGWTTITALQSLAYYAFEKAVWDTFGQRIRTGAFDLVHRVTPVSPTSVSTLASKCARVRVPFLIGPLNGGLPWPPNFGHRRRAEREWLSYIRGIYRLMPGYSSTRKHAAVILVGSEATKRQISRQHEHKVVYLPENGIDFSRFTKRRTRKASRPLTGVFVGRLVPYKCPDILIEASAHLMRAGQLKLRIIGDGPMRPELSVIANREGVNASIEFLGWLDHTSVQAALADADFLALPSIREFGGGVVLEAMACGVPPIVADYGGPAELVTTDVGFKVPFSDEDSLRKNLTETLTRLIERPEEIDIRSERAICVVEEQYSWPAKALKIKDIYGKCLATRSAPCTAAEGSAKDRCI